MSPHKRRSLSYSHEITEKVKAPQAPDIPTLRNAISKISNVQIDTASLDQNPCLYQMPATPPNHPKLTTVSAAMPNTNPKVTCPIDARAPFPLQVAQTHFRA